MSSQLHLFDTPPEPARDWILANRDAWWSMQHCLLDVLIDEPECKCIKRNELERTMQRYYGIRSMSFEPEVYRFDNNLWPGVARYLIKYHPELDAIIHIRRRQGYISDEPSFMPELPADFVVTPNARAAHRVFVERRWGVSVGV